MVRHNAEYSFFVIVAIEGPHEGTWSLGKDLQSSAEFLVGESHCFEDKFGSGTAEGRLSLLLQKLNSQSDFDFD